MGNDSAMRRLEAIVHPAVQAERWPFWRPMPGSPLVVMDVPLLFETGGERLWIRCWCYRQNRPCKRQGLLARAGMNA